MNEGQLGRAMRAVDDAIGSPLTPSLNIRPPAPGPVTQLITERHKTHGEYSDTSRIAQELKSTMRACPAYATLSPDKQESLDMIASKIARILSGNAETPDHFDDIAGYAMLAKVRIK